MTVEMVNGVPVIKKSEGTVFGGPTLNDRIRDEKGKLTRDTIPLSFGGVGTVPAGTDTIVGTDDVEVKSVTLNKPAIAVAVGATETITASILPANATDKTVQWSSRDIKKATVNAAGAITGVAKGTVVIEAIAGSVKAECVVTVT